MTGQKHRFEDEPEKLGERREKALDDLPELDMPESIRTPGRTWTRLPEDLDIESEAVEPGIKAGGEAEVYTGGEAAEKAGDRLLDAVKQDENRMNALHTAKMNSLVYIRATGEAEVEIRYTDDSATFAHLVVDARQGSELTVTEYFRGASEINSSIAEFYVGKNASLTYGSVHSGGCELDYAARKAVVSRDGSMRWLNSVFGPELAKQRLETVLRGDGSSTGMLGAFYPIDEQHHDVSMRVRHRGENTSCDMNTRGVVDDRARSAYEGLQDVGPDAENTSSFQHENTLLLSEKAEADASPKLMIENNDVEATHAAAAGRVPEDEMHYMKSRGLSESAARRLVVKGFFEPLMDEVELPELKQELRKQVLQKLEA